MQNDDCDLTALQEDKPVWSAPRLQRLSLVEVEAAADLDVAFTCTYTQPTSDLR
jgi:hypothetical protein